ncbi:Efflux pump atB [Ceratocystis fimbriata CBS 114723]|uniref:Efflux pump atB n=1 Tax=Ceratocystis fimbriata CBS 114723 TaxID=1035309 RepID=A0A2C5WKG3_9PEZI|nr:Efflux pump atB [Ceratocystis fimbriata CBS 114723]
MPSTPEKQAPSGPPANICPSDLESQTMSISPSSTSRESSESNHLSPLPHALTPISETEAERTARELLGHVQTTTSLASVASRLPEFEVTLDENDPENPRNWPIWYRTWTMFVLSFSTWLIVLYSTSYTASIPGFVAEFDTTTTTATLGVTTYLLGLAVGTLVLAPLSEIYGRHLVYVVGMIAASLLIIPCATAQSLTTLIVTRFFGALFGSAFIANAPGSIVDISHEETRALVMSLWSIGPLNGPSTGPLIGGFLYQYLGWRMAAWIVMGANGVAVICLLTLKETYAPAILKRKTAQMRKEMDDPRYWCKYDQRVSTIHLLKLNLSRPFVLSATEPILWFFNIWISLIYGILYLCFVAYPIVFRQYRGWDAAHTGMSFLGIASGVMIVIACEPVFRRIINLQPKDRVTGRTVPEATAVVMTIGAFLTPIGQLAFSWTCLPVSIHWALPICSGIIFGAGNTISFIYGLNYIANAYGIFAASALAGNAVIRSVFGGTLPLIGPIMYEKLTPQWAGTLLGLLEVALIPIPIVFWRYGARIRAKSPVLMQMREDEAKAELKRAKREGRKTENMKPTVDARIGPVSSEKAVVC